MEVLGKRVGGVGAREGEEISGDEGFQEWRKRLWDCWETGSDVIESGSDVIVFFQENEILGSKLGKGNSPFVHAWASLICGKLEVTSSDARRRCVIELWIHYNLSYMKY